MSEELDRLRALARSATSFELYGFDHTLTASAADVAGQVHPDDVARVVEQLEAALADGADWGAAVRLRMPDGAIKYAQVAVRAVIAGDGTRRCIGAAMDITAATRTAAAHLDRARDEAAAANRAKDDFLANVGHEIRTPMNAVLGMTELVLETEVTDEQRQWLRTAKSAADNLLAIIDDLLDFSKIEAGTLELHPTEFRLRAELEVATRALALRAERKGLALRSTIAAAVPDELVGDVGRLRQVLTNLVGNAIKFTERGEIAVDIAAHALEGTAIVLTVAVRDTGIGIPADKQDVIFQPFTQQDESTTRVHGGTGLGLAIAGRLVDLMGGELRVVSEPGRGSTFTFTARFTRAPGTARPPAPATSPRARLLDPDVLLASCDGDAEILGRVVAALQAQLPKELAAAHARFDAGDAAGLRERAHRLQGMVSTVSTVVAMVASELEDEAANHRLETSAGLLARLDAMSRTLLASLREISVADLLAARADRAP